MRWSGWAWGGAARLVHDLKGHTITVSHIGIGHRPSEARARACTCICHFMIATPDAHELEHERALRALRDD